MKLELVVLAVVSACSSGHAREEHRKAEPVAPHDAGSPGVTKISGFDPNTGMHLDDDGTTPPQPAVVAPVHPGRPIDVTLRSSPPGAQVAVDGEIVGTTPTFWSGQADGRPHEFTFVLPGHAVARYRFVPVTSGVIHVRLEPVTEEPDGGVDDDNSTTGAPVPGAGSVLVNPPPAPVAKPDSAPIAPPPAVTDDAAPTGMGPQP